MDVSDLLPCGGKEIANASDVVYSAVEYRSTWVAWISTPARDMIISVWLGHFLKGE